MTDENAQSAGADIIDTMNKISKSLENIKEELESIDERLEGRLYQERFGH